ncbi:MAG TPA: cytochrome c1 [Parvibaculum sp.]
MKMKMIQKLSAVAAVATVALGAAFLSSASVQAAEHEPAMEHIDWSFNGPFGTFDRNQLRRGYKVYKEVCSTCHSMNFVHFRNLGEEGGPEFTAPEVKALAAGYQVSDGPNQAGDMFERPGEGKDAFPAPYANEEAAAASLGAAPPDLSLIAKAREGGPDYIHALLNGYTTAPAGVTLPAGGHYNPVFVAGNGVIAMPPPLSDGQVDYTDGTPNTLEQMSKDVAAFLMWTAEPKLEQRHRLGFQVFIYLLALAGILFVATRKVWSDQH